MSTFTGFSNDTGIIYDKKASKILSKDHWRVLTGFRYYLRYKNSNMYVDVPEGTLSDGATTPRFLWSLIPPWGEYAQAVILHDRLCEYPFITVYRFGKENKEEINRKEIDRIFFEALRVLKVSRWKYYLIRSGVSLYRIVKNANSTKELNPIKRKMEINFDEEERYQLLLTK